MSFFFNNKSYRKWSLFQLLYLALPILFIPSALAQTHSDLTKRRKQLMREIEEASQLLASTKKNKVAALDQYYAIEQQITQRQALVETLRQEVDLSTESITRTSLAIEALQSDIQRLQKEYTAMAKQAYRDKMSNNQLLFLLSAKSFNEGIKRWRYIQQYNSYRKKQATLILETSSSLTKKLDVMEVKKAAQEKLLLSEQRQQRLLQQELVLRNQILKDIEANESRISKAISDKKKAHQLLSQAIERIITLEMNSPTNEERANLNKAPSNKNKAASNTVEKNNSEDNVANLSSKFQQQKGNLSWPVTNGIIVRHFGKQAHPIHKKIMIDNNGVDIRAVQNNKVFSVFGGKIVGTQFVPGYQNTLIIQHGVYYSVYSNLETVVVKKGDLIRSRQFLGTSGKSHQSNYLEVHLEIWKGKQRLNPAIWLAKK